MGGRGGRHAGKPPALVCERVCALPHNPRASLAEGVANGSRVNGPEVRIEGAYARIRMTAHPEGVLLKMNGGR